jgi:hypothetical protein
VNTAHNSATFALKPLAQRDHRSPMQVALAQIEPKQAH